MSMQAMVDAMSKQWLRERSETQLTLGDLIEALRALPSDAEIENIGRPHSYRGYYTDLAFQRGDSRIKIKAVELLAMCIDAENNTFKGYKGGDFIMNGSTPLWIADYGSCGVKIMAINPDGTFATAADD